MCFGAQSVNPNDVTPKTKHSISDYSILKILGKGSFADVYMVRRKRDGRLFAMKIVHKDKILMKSEDKSLTIEELAERNMKRFKLIISERTIFS